MTPMSTPVVETIRPGVAFTPAAAASFRRAEADWGRRIDVNSTYRDYNKQLAMFLAWNRYMASGFKASLYPGHSRALHPDFSAHCLALALDSDDWVTPGFIAFMADRGWIRTAANDPTERHHFEYQWWRDNHRNRPSGLGVAGGVDIEELTPKKEEDEDMALIRVRDADTGSIAIANVAGGLFHEITDPAYERLYDGWKIWDRTKDVELPSNIYLHYKSLAHEARGSIDINSLATAVVSKLPLNRESDLDEGALSALIVTGIEAALSDDFTALPDAVLDAEVRRLSN